MPKKGFVDKATWEVFCTTKSQKQLQASFHKIYKSMWKPLYKIAYVSTTSREQAEDFIHDTFAQLIEDKEKIDWRRNPEAWVFRVLVNLCRNWARKKKPKIEDPTQIDSNDSYQLLPEEKVLALEIVKYLSPYQRFILYLRDVCRFTGKEASQLLGCLPSTVNSTLIVARKKVQNKLEKDENQKRILHAIVDVLHEMFKDDLNDILGV